MQQSIILSLFDMNYNNNSIYYIMHEIANVEQQIKRQEEKILKDKEIGVDPIYNESIYKKLKSKKNRLQHKLNKEMNIALYGGVIRNNIEYRDANNKS